MDTPLQSSTPAHAMRRRWTGYVLVLLAGSFWACLGIFFTWLKNYNIPPTAIALNRALVSGLTLLVVMLVRNPAALRFKLRDTPYFVIYSIGIALFFLVYVEAVNKGGVALASVLLYTAPVWVVLFAWLRWHEPLTPFKIIALLLAVLGSALVALGAGTSQTSGGTWAITLGLLSGVAYAAYSLLSNEGLRRGYQPITIVMIVMLMTAVWLVPFQDWNAVQRALTTPATWMPLLGVGWVSSLLAPVCYAAGQQRIGASTAGILATVEPVLAAILAWLIFNERLTVMQMIGGMCVLAAVLVIAQATSKPKGHSHDELT